MHFTERPRMSRSNVTRKRPRVVHLSTDHRADDVRVFERECRSLAGTGKYDVYVAASGQMPSNSGVSLIPLTGVSENRAERFALGPPKAWALARLLDVDLWHFHALALLPIAVGLARRGHKVIWDAHEDFSEQFTESGAKSWVPGPLRGAVRAGTNSMLNWVAGLPRRSSWRPQQLVRGIRTPAQLSWETRRVWRTSPTSPPIPIRTESSTPHPRSVAICSRNSWRLWSNCPAPI